MESKDKNYLRLLDGLKASNISSNESSLNVASNQIEMILSKHFDSEELKSKDPVLQENITKSLKAIRKTYENKYLSTDEKINSYIEFGDIFQLIVDDLMNMNEKEDYLKEIATQYLKIADKVNDGRVTTTAIDIAKKISSKKK